MWKLPDDVRDEQPPGALAGQTLRGSAVSLRGGGGSTGMVNETNISATPENTNGADDNEENDDKHRR